jgi:hypothetical protein
VSECVGGWVGVCVCVSVCAQTPDNCTCANLIAK